MYCNQCGHELSEREKFCTVCGEPVEKASETEKTASTKNDTQLRQQEQNVNSTQLTIESTELADVTRAKKPIRKKASIAIAAILALALAAFVYTDVLNNEKRTDVNTQNGAVLNSPDDEADNLAVLVEQVSSADFDLNKLTDCNLSDNDSKAIQDRIEDSYLMFGKDFVFSKVSNYHDNGILFYTALNYYWPQNGRNIANADLVCKKVNLSAADCNYKWEAKAVDAYLRDGYGIEIDHSLNEETFGNSNQYRDGYYYGEMYPLDDLSDKFGEVKINECKTLSDGVIYTTFSIDVYTFGINSSSGENKYVGTYQGNAILQKNSDDSKFLYRLLKLSISDADEAAKFEIKDGTYNFQMSLDNIQKTSDGWNVKANNIKYNTYTNDEVNSWKVGSVIDYAGNHVTIKGIANENDHLGGEYVDDGIIKDYCGIRFSDSDFPDFFLLERPELVWYAGRYDSGPAWYCDGYASLFIPNSALLEFSSPDITTASSLEALLAGKENTSKVQNVVVTVKNGGITEVCQMYRP